jgi:4-amino-4-deoxy-L-arabinose transferase-like glycosyltransferase
LPVALLVAVALLVRLGVIVATPGYDPRFDARDYDRHARSIARGDGYPPTTLAAPRSPSAHRPPGYPLALAGVYELSGGSVTAGRVLGAALGALTALLTFVVAGAIWRRGIGLLAGWLVAVFPPFIKLNTALLSESLFLPLELGAAAAVLAFGRTGGRLRWAVVAGVLCGLATLTRTTGALLVIPAAIGVWAARPGFRPHVLAAPAAVAVAAVLAISPWTIRNAIVFDEFVPVTTQAGYTLAGTYNSQSERPGPLHGAVLLPRELPEYRDLFHRPGRNEVAIDRELRREATSFARDHPLYVLEVIGRNSLQVFDLAANPFRELWNREMEVSAGERRWIGASVLAVTALALIGVAGTAGALPVGRPPRWFWLFPLLMFLSAVFLSGKPRYRAPTDPFLLMLAAVAVVGVSERIRRGTPRRRRHRLS